MYPVKKLQFALGLLALPLALSGCATDRLYGEAAGIEIAELDTLPAPGIENLYVIGAQQALEIEVVGAERLSGMYLTDGQGRISFPLVGLLDLGGLASCGATTF